MPAPITLIVIVTTLAQASVFAVRPMVSYRALELGAGPFELGVVGGAFSLLSLFFGVPAGAGWTGAENVSRSHRALPPSQSPVPH